MQRHIEVSWNHGLNRLCRYVVSGYLMPKAIASQTPKNQLS
jgi:hypothetical protein